MSVLPRQAVVIVHGIGEQRPLETLRSFVGSTENEGIVDKLHPRFSAPDNLRGRFFERRIKVTWDQNHVAKALREQPHPPQVQWRQANTDFFELYWAYGYRDSRLGHILSWALPHVRRSRKDLFSTRLLGTASPVLRYTVPLLVLLAVAWFVVADKLWLRDWFPAISQGSAAVIAIVAGILSLSIAVLIAGHCGLLSFIRAGILVVLAIFAGGILLFMRGDTGFVEVLGAVSGSAVVSAALAAILSVLVKSLGDAARYLDNTPDNVGETDSIQVEAVKLLRALHESVDERSGRPNYDRVIVVGHSLGTVVGYDAIRNLWAQLHQDLGFPDDGDSGPDSLPITSVETSGVALVDREHSEVLRNNYRAAQTQLAQWLRSPPADDRASSGSSPRWIISDFVTLACPLAHADLLVAKSVKELGKLKRERVLATCPPDPQTILTASGRPYRFRKPGNDKFQAQTFLHHAAPFAPVRWTNFYFAHDIVGGPLAPILGAGIEDHQLGKSKSFLDMALHYPHSSYWQDKEGFSFNSAGTRSTRDFLRRLVRRRPTLLISIPATTDGDVLDQVEQALANHMPTPPEVEVFDVRLFVEDETGQRRSARFPIPEVAGPDAVLLSALRRIVKKVGGRVTLLVSPNVETGPPGEAPEGFTLSGGEDVDEPEEDDTDELNPETPDHAEEEEEEEEEDAEDEGEEE